jgi:hypothetical protein
VLASVPREERHGDAPDVADVERRRGVTVRRLHGHFLDVLEEGIEAGSAEDPDVGGAQAERSLALPEDGDELPLSPEEDLPSVDFESAFFSAGFFSEELSELFSELPSELFSELFLEPSPEDFDRLSVE